MPKPKKTLIEKIDGEPLKPFTSFHTHRVLKPYIRRDFETEPLKLKMLRQIDPKLPKYPIDYTYIQPKHVNQINRLACHFFWKGIDGKILIFRFSDT